jgi:hypothetical protein
MMPSEHPPPHEGGARHTPGASTPAPSTADELLDKINGLVQALAADYVSTSSWSEILEKFRGQEGDFHPQIKRLPHAAAELLEDLHVTVDKVKLSTPKWTMAQKEAALARGPHQSSDAHTAFLHSEFFAMIQKKHLILLPAALVTTEEELGISPLGVLPQQDRRIRSIIDYTFYCINEETVVMAPPESMQFGKALW